MHIEINTDNHIEGSAGLSRHVEDVIREALNRFSGQVTRVGVHFSDETSAAKGGKDDKQCRIEVRLAGMQPIAVSAGGESIEQALRAAARKVEAALGKAIGKLESR